MKKLLWILLIPFLFLACNKGEHFLKDESYRQRVHEQFEKRKSLAENRSEALFSVFEKRGLTLEQREALEFLYAYMPLSDLADYDGEFFLDQVDAAFKARDYFSWGKNIPDGIFRHFVLVYRVNNEDLDTARLAFFEELKDRVKDLSMYEAALEVNHWCHEKVTYRGTDPRTSSPLALVKTSWGRCGEQSAFTATALRSVGIPARQCYTPRWVHTDSNHAWVEVWIDGEWHYLGACEPEPELDMAWFTDPAKRAMMVHTNVFGYYTGPEEKTLETPLYSVINLLDNYAETRRLKVSVTDGEYPLANIRVQFKVYNYAQFYPIATLQTNEQGEAFITTGMGDVLIWADDGDSYTYTKSTKEENEISLVLRKEDKTEKTETIVMNAPLEQPSKSVSSNKMEANAVRLIYEDSVRNAYMNTFISKEKAYSLAEMHRWHGGFTWKYLSMAQGNWKEIRSFMVAHENSSNLFSFLGLLTEKDLRDTPADYLADFIKKTHDLEKMYSYIYSPRIERELIRPWRSYLQSQFTAEEQEAFRARPELLVEYVSERITINKDENYYNCRISPKGTHELRVADAKSRDIYFVALCRSFNIPAQINPQDGKVYFYKDGNWIKVFDENQERESADNTQGTVKINLDPTNSIKPNYQNHFTLSRYEQGDFLVLDLRDEFDPSMNELELNMSAGYYRLIIGSRANDGSVTTNVQYAELKPSGTITFNVKLPETEGKVLVKGIVDMNTIIETTGGEKKTLKEIANGKGLMLCLVDMGREPSVHILQDFPSVKPIMDEWGGGVLLISPDTKLNATFDASNFKNLPEQTVWGVDRGEELLTVVAETLQLDPAKLPLTLYMTNNGGVLYTSEGYRIGIGEEVFKTIVREKQSQE